MNLKPYLYIALPLALLVPCINAIAQDYNETNSSGNSNIGYGGVKWTLGDSILPEIVAGYRYASVTSSGATQGGDLSISVKITGKTELNNLIHLGKLRAKYLNGINYLQGEVGGGWDFAKNGVFAGIGAQGPYVNAGVDYDFTGVNSFGKSFSPYAGFNSIGIYAKKTGNTAKNCQLLRQNVLDLWAAHRAGTDIRWNSSDDNAPQYYTDALMAVHQCDPTITS